MADVVIVGGGVYGTACAWHLARAGAAVTVLERRTLASGASGGPGRRGVRTNGRDRRELPLMRAALPIWSDLGEVLGAGGLFEQTGNLMLIEREDDLPKAQAQARLQNAHGIETLVLDAAGVRDLEPEATPRILAGIYCPGDGLSDHGATTRAYGAAARAAGAVIREGEAVAEIMTQGGRATGVRLESGEAVEAGAVLAVSNWSVAGLIRPFAELPTWNRAFQVLVSRPLPTMPVRHVVGHASRILSLKAEPGRRLMISG